MLSSNSKIEKTLGQTSPGRIQEGLKALSFSERDFAPSAHPARQALSFYQARYLIGVINGQAAAGIVRFAVCGSN